jgi:hypothetical protein
MTQDRNLFESGCRTWIASQLSVLIPEAIRIAMRSMLSTCNKRGSHCGPTGRTAATDLKSRRLAVP